MRRWVQKTKDEVGVGCVSKLISGVALGKPDAKQHTTVKTNYAMQEKCSACGLACVKHSTNNRKRMRLRIEKRASEAKRRKPGKSRENWY